MLEHCSPRDSSTTAPHDGTSLVEFFVKKIRVDLFQILVLTSVGRKSEGQDKKLIVFWWMLTFLVESSKQTKGLD